MRFNERERLNIFNCGPAQKFLDPEAELPDLPMNLPVLVSTVYMEGERKQKYCFTGLAQAPRRRKLATQW